MHLVHAGSVSACQAKTESTVWRNICEFWLLPLVASKRHVTHMCKKHSTGPTNEHGGCAIAQTGMTQQPLAKVDLQCRVYKLTGDLSLLHCSMRVGYRRHETGRQIGGPVCYRPRSFKFGKSWLAAWPPPREKKKKNCIPQIHLLIQLSVTGA